MKRYRYLTLAIIIGVAVISFAVSMFLGDKKQGSIKTELPGIEFHATGVRGFSNKAKALERAREIRSNGGAGFVDYDGEWFVIERVGEGDMKFSAEPVKVDLAKEDDRETLDALIKSFEENVAVLQALSGKSAREVSFEALRLYNELNGIVSNFDMTGSVVYSETSVAVNKQLLA